MAQEFRVIGPPGTGKTTWLSRQAQHAAEKHGPNEGMLTSLTRDPAGRKRGSGMKKLGKQQLAFFLTLAQHPNYVSIGLTKSGIRLAETLVSRGIVQHYSETTFKVSFEGLRYYKSGEWFYGE